ncbi:MAG: hypothetical protein IM477_18025 [Microcystis sp. M090S1]|uniref:hypothetical protein n=1 Tax=Microcystis sp. M090S1 TaxID=2771135 RepID=UPI00258BEC0B|nr:hypothetical protein [Microcystis sp. M090S1]MCA2814321.1 hypothetical protein [Microcystis sp. M090S1]
MIGDYLVEYLVLLPWGNEEVGKWGVGKWGVGKWGVGRINKIISYLLTPDSYLLTAKLTDFVSLPGQD